MYNLNYNNCNLHITISSLRCNLYLLKIVDKYKTQLTILKDFLFPKQQTQTTALISSPLFQKFAFQYSHKSNTTETHKKRPPKKSSLIFYYFDYKNLIIIHRNQEFLITSCFPHLVLHKVHCFNRSHIRQVISKYPNPIQALSFKKQVFSTGT